MKRIILFTLTVVLCANVILIGCTRIQGREDSTSNILNNETFPVLDDWRFLERDTHIDEYRLWERSFGEIKEEFGEPISIQYYEIFPPAADSEYLMIAEYPGFEVDFDLVDIPEEDDDLSNTVVMFFDIIGPQHSFKGISVGMPQPEASELPHDSNLYNIDIINTTKDILTLEDWQIMLAKRVLTNFRPIDYYSENDSFLYMECWDEITDDPDWPGDHCMALGAVILFKNGKVARIVFGLPMAG